MPYIIYYFKKSLQNCGKKHMTRCVFYITKTIATTEINISIIVEGAIKPI